MLSRDDTVAQNGQVRADVGGDDDDIHIVPRDKFVIIDAVPVGAVFHGEKPGLLLVRVHNRDDADVVPIIDLRDMFFPDMAAAN